VPTAPGNRAFDADLRARNPAWGLRRRRRPGGGGRGRAAGLLLRERVAMPANNLLLVWPQRGGLRPQAGSEAFCALNYLPMHPLPATLPALLAQVQRLLAEGRLAETLAARHPEPHTVRSERALV
jgi:hypothetical protein